jgi:uncharacterized protein
VKGRTAAGRPRPALRSGWGLVPILLAYWVGTVPGAGAAGADLPIRVGPASFRVEQARTDEENHRGLMFRRQLPRDHGMLFFQKPGRAGFWMKNTLIPLDLLYFDSDGILLEIIAGAVPCRQRDCPIYSSRALDVRYILEINGGEAARRGIRVGDRLELD